MGNPSKKKTMKVYSHLSRGIYHPNFNEDNQFTDFLSDRIFVGAVMDGCSSALESHFASSLYKKSLHKSARILKNMNELDDDFNLEEMKLREIANFMLKQLFGDLSKSKRLFFLETTELLTTLILMVYDGSTGELLICSSGDGLYVVNEEIYEIDQDNRPDFLGYHLNEDFGGLDATFIESRTFENARDVAVSTDGIQKLSQAGGRLSPDLDPADLLLLQDPGPDGENFLLNRYEKLLKMGYLALDDISLIRVIRD